jgi:hypothetical protein
LKAFCSQLHQTEQWKESELGPFHHSRNLQFQIQFVGVEAEVQQQSQAGKMAQSLAVSCGSLKLEGLAAQGAANARVLNGRSSTNAVAVRRNVVVSASLSSEEAETSSRRSVLGLLAATVVAGAFAQNANAVVDIKLDGPPPLSGGLRKCSTLALFSITPGSTREEFLGFVLTFGLVSDTFTLPNVAFVANFVRSCLGTASFYFRPPSTFLHHKFFMDPDCGLALWIA